MSTRSGEILAVIGIGASAGGLEALQEFLSHLPPQLQGVALIIAQHLSPTHKSRLVELLSRDTGLTVLEASQHQQLLPNHVYITPPDSDIRVGHGRIYLSKPFNVMGPKPSVDILFQSLADDLAESAIGIIFSGTGSDGALGVMALKEKGGRVLVQDPESARYDGMPLAAIQTGAVDMVSVPEQMGVELLELLSAQISAKPVPAVADNADFERLFQLLSRRTGTDFANYKPSTFFRRLDKRMGQLGISDLSAYLYYINEHPGELDALFNTLLIGVTAFFRDPAAFSALENNFAQLLAKKMPGDPIRIWVPGCATGEEPYSLAIILNSLLKDRIQQHPIQIFATDIDERAIAIARRGLYPQSSLEHISTAYLEQYFLRKGDDYELLKNIRSLVLFSKHDITHNPPFLKLDLISCRNLLIYFGANLQKHIMPIFHYALNPNGYLFLGKSETVGQFSDLFAVVNGNYKLFQRKPGESLYALKFSAFKPHLKPARPILVRKPRQELPLAEIIKETLFNTFEHPYVVINEVMDIQEIRGDVSIYLGLREGSMNVNLLKMVREELQIELRAVVNRAIADRQQVKTTMRRFVHGGQEHWVVVSCRPMLHPESLLELYLVVFEAQSPPIAAGAITSTFDSEAGEQLRLLELEQELTATKAHLQTYIEELETSNEELQSLNEEMQSTNEELQSANEELETSNEELQSTNEEIQIAYQELKATHDALEQKEISLRISETHTQALLNNTVLGFILVDKHYRILKFNTRAHELLQPVSTALENNRPVIDLFPLPQLETFLGDFTQAIAGTVVQRREYAFGDRWLLMHMLPVLDGDGQAEVVAISLEDVTEVKRLNQNLLRSEKLMSSIFQVAATGICITDDRGIFYRVNDAYCAIYGYTRDELIGQHFTMMLPPDERATVAQMHDAFMAGETELPGEWIVMRKNGSLLAIYATASLLVQEDGTRYKITSVTDITENHKYRNLLQETQEAAKVGGWEYDLMTHELSWTDEVFHIYGLDTNTPLNLETMLLSYTQDAHNDLSNALDVAIETGDPFDIELERNPQSEHSQWVRATCRPIRLQHQTIKLFGTIQDISLLKQAQQELHMLSLVASETDIFVLITNAQGRIEWANAAFILRAGYTLEMIKNCVPSELLAGPGTSVQELERFQQALATGQVFHHELLLYSQQQEPFWARVSLTPVVNHRGQLDNYIVLMSDVTERHAQEQERQRLMDDLLRQNKDLLQFSYIVSHHLRAPVANLEGILKLLQSDTLSPIDREMVMHLSDSAAQLERVMQDLNRILALRTPVHETREPLRLSDLWKQVQDSLKIQLAGCQASVQGDFSAIDEILGVRSYLQNILHTLLSNAIKYRNPQRPLHIRLSAEVSQGQVVIVFQDNGLGIDLKRYGNKLFGLYKRFHPHIPGRGLKLHLAKTEIEALGGSIRVESAPDQGACFCVMLPLPPLIGG